MTLDYITTTLSGLEGSYSQPNSLNGMKCSSYYDASLTVTVGVCT